MKFLSTFLIVTALSASAMAQSVFTPLVEALNAITNATPYETLEAIFKGTSPAQTKDFPSREDFSKNGICMRHLAADVTPQTTRESMRQSLGCLVLVRLSRVIEKGAPSSSELGPLFPKINGVPDSKETYFVVGEFPPFYSREAVIFAERLQRTVTTAQYILTVTPTSFVASFNEKGKPYTVEYHSAKGLVIGKVIEGGKTPVITYDYGWIEGAKDPGGNP